jgi:PAS domain S-box-containing protein
MIITDPRRPDNPIVFANASFLELTGYSRDEVIGSNCRFLQGPESDQASIRVMREAIEAKTDIAIDILNYRKDGTKFWNGLHISPVTSTSGELQFFFASQVDVTDRIEAQTVVADQQVWLVREVTRQTLDLREAHSAQTMLVHEVDHRVKNNMQMISALLSMQSRAIEDPSARALVDSMLQRVEAIGTVQRRLYQSNNVQQFDLALFLRDLCKDLIKAFGRSDIELSLDLKPTNVSAQQASPFALMLNEILTNALKHAFPSRRRGTLFIELRNAPELMTIYVSDDGVGMPDARLMTGFGSRLVTTLARQLEAEVVWLPGRPGTVVEIKLPYNKVYAEPVNE